MYYLQAVGSAQLLAQLLTATLVLAASLSNQKHQYEQSKSVNYDEFPMKQQQQQQPSAENQEELGEQVDRMASASGDKYQNHPQHGQYSSLETAILQELERPRFHEDYAPSGDMGIEALWGEYPLALFGSSDQGGPQQTQGLLRTDKREISESNNNHQLDDDTYQELLVDQFKHSSPVANPLRQIRAFRPKLMSTARGFGKRARLEGGTRGLTTHVNVLVPRSADAILRNFQRIGRQQQSSRNGAGNR